MSKETETFFIEKALLLLKERRQITLQEIENKQNICPNSEGAAALNDFFDTETATCQPHQFTYFYQSPDGQNAYLHPINFKMIEELYGGHLENFPVTISGKIVQKEYFFMNGELKKRFKYLEHLPVTSEFTMIEIDFTDPKMPQSILERFQGKLNMYL